MPLPAGILLLSGDALTYCHTNGSLVSFVQLQFIIEHFPKIGEQSLEGSSVPSREHPVCLDETSAGQEQCEPLCAQNSRMASRDGPGVATRVGYVG